MPGVIMEDRLGNGSHTNHDRNPRHNGINGTNYASEKGQDKGKARAEPQQNMTPVSPVIFNGVNGSFPSDAARNQNGGNGGTEMHDRANELPPEILHITYGYLPLSQLLTRLAQQSHSKLSKQIVELAHMPLPTPAVNGNSGHSPESSDNSIENVSKKMNLLNFTQDLHADWTKALVITEWSRKAADVSKIIDLKIFLQSQHSHYLAALDGMGMLKRDLAQAKIPNPDLKTALEVLSTGKASWMPELGYIEPPPLTAREILKQLEDLNTLLSIRLNLHEYERVPFQFKNYSIKSGRVTFIVPGEFEVDLTIADEDPESQFWFIDFRFLFSPSLSDLTENLRSHIENKVNAVLLKDGLPGCYKYLHELVLTHKISEFRRQAVELSRGRWIEGVMVEPLNRALCIQYWLDRYGKDGPKSWILLGVHSGRRKDGLPDPKATSRLFLRWFRDSKEVKDIDIPFDDIEISVETLLKRVVAMHIKHILTATYDKLNKRELFANHEAALSLTTSSTEPMESGLKVQLTGKQLVTIAIEQVTGRFTFSPASRLGWDCERRLNGSSPDPATDAEVYVAQLRCTTLGFEIASRASSVGWLALSGAPPGLKRHDLSDVMPKKVVDGFKDSRWFKRPGWSQDWLVVVTLSMDGDHWWLMKTAPIPTGIKVTKAVEIPIKGNWASEPTFSFLSTLHIFAAALICLYTNLDALHSRRIRHRLQDSRKPLSIHVPGILVDLPSLLPSSKESRSKMFSQDVVKLTFQGLEMRRADSLGAESGTPSITPALPQGATPTQNPSMSGPQKAPSPVELAVMVTEARMVIPGKLTMLQERVDQDMAFQAATGVFAFRLRSQVGEIIIPSLIQRLSQVERLVDFVEVVSRHRNTLHCESISLGKIVFTYSSESMPAPPAGSVAMDVDKATKRYRATVEFSAAENSMKLTLERNNPHIRLMDHLSKIINSPEGLGGVATCLPLTLPALRGLDNMEEAWQDLFEKGDVVVHIRSAQWYTVRYTFSTVSPKQSSRKILFDLKLLQRRGESWWNIRRVDQREKDGDDIDEKLKSVWNGSGHGWFGARMSAIARPAGVEDCLEKIDEVIRMIAADDKPAEVKPQPVPVNTNLRAPVAPMAPMAAPMAPMAQMQPQAQMMPTAPMMQRHLSNQQHKAQSQRPNATQNQGRNMPNQPQGRPASMMNQARKPAQPKEFIEID